MGLEHTTKQNKIVLAKRFKSQVLCCKNACASKISVDQQQEIFSTYYDSCNWTTKTMFIRANVDKENCAKNNSLNPILNLRNRQYNYKYSFLNESGIKTNVSKKFFLNCIQVTSDRVYRAIKSININPSAKEHRGSGPSSRKTNELDMRNLKDFINKFPRYQSHYGRSSSDKEYLSPHLNIMKMYREYRLECEFRKVPVLSEHIFREVFNKQFNLSFKRPKVDTFKLCDIVNLKISSRDISYKEQQIHQQCKNEHIM